MGKQNQDQNTQQVPVKDRTVFLSGLPYECTEEEIRTFFQDLGAIDQIKLPKFQDSGKCRGFSHVTFENAEDVEEALKLNKQKIGKRYVDISQAKGEKEQKKIDKSEIPDSCKTIFVKNLPYNTSEDAVGDFFKEKCGDVENVRFSYNTVQNHFKGFCYIDFKFNSSVRRAVTLHGLQFEGRPLYIDYEVGAAKSGYKVKHEEDGNSKYIKSAKEIQNKKIKKEKKEFSKGKGLQNFSGKKHHK